MTLDEKINQRRVALAIKNRQATGIVCDYDTYLAITRADNNVWEYNRYVPQHLSYDGNAGDTYMGLDIAITKRPNTLIIY